MTKNSTQAFYAPIHSIMLQHNYTADLVIEGVDSFPFSLLLASNFLWDSKTLKQQIKVLSIAKCNSFRYSVLIHAFMSKLLNFQYGRMGFEETVS